MAKKYYVEYTGQWANGQLKDAGYVFDNPEDCLNQIENLYLEDISNGCYEEDSYSMWVVGEDGQLLPDEMEEPVYHIYDINEEDCQTIVRDNIQYSLVNDGGSNLILVSMPDSQGDYYPVCEIRSEDNTHRDWHAIINGSDPREYWEDGCGQSVGDATLVERLAIEIASVRHITPVDAYDDILHHNRDGRYLVNGNTDIDDAIQVVYGG